jgi:imidazolonepropionase-like amidohydrolase
VCADDLLLKNVNIVDADTGSIIVGRSVIVSDGRIKEIGAQEAVRTPAGARVVDATGRYLMPALWDMHTHPMGPEAYESCRDYRVILSGAREWSSASSWGRDC